MAFTSPIEVVDLTTVVQGSNPLRSNIAFYSFDEQPALFCADECDF